MNTRTQARQNDEGFTLIELLIVMSVMLILMTMIIPSVLKVTKSANQTSAMNSVKAIGSAEGQYMSAFPVNGFSCSLAALGGASGTPPTPQSAQVLDPTLAQGNKSGYTFNITNCTKVTVQNTDQYTGYEITAVPNSIGRSGDRGYCMDESGVLKYDPTGGTNCTQTVQ
jgi:type IV pilus assembly protein PilA